MKRKILFVLFAEDGCRQAHALWYALDLHQEGHAVRLVLEGPATGMLARLADPGFEAGPLLRQVREAGLLAGACLRASLGCGCDADATTSPSVQAARDADIALLDGMDGHASIATFVREGFEIVVI